MLDKLKELVPKGESAIQFSYAMLGQYINLPKNEIRRQLKELQELNQITVEGNEITINSYKHRIRRCIIPEHIKAQVYAKFKNHCAYCGDKLTVETRTVDHIIPLVTEGSSNNITNLFPACTYCNSLKSADTLSDFKVNLRVDMFYFEKLIGTKLY